MREILVDAALVGLSALPDFCPLHSPAEHHGSTRRLGVAKGWIFFADGCRQSQRTGEVIAGPAGSASSEPLPIPGKAPLQIVK